MTVIAYDGRVVAADTAMYVGTRRMVATSRKIIPLERHGETVVFAAAGCASGAMEALRWLVEFDLERASMLTCNGGVTMAIIRLGKPIEGYELGAERWKSGAVRRGSAVRLRLWWRLHGCHEQRNLSGALVVS